MIDGNLRGSRKSKEGKARALPFEPAKGREAPGGVEGQSPRLAFLAFFYPHRWA